MLRAVVVAALFAASLIPGQAEAASHKPASFTHRLDQDGFMSAGWLEVLPRLASTCNLRLDNQELTAKLIDLSRQDGNIAYTQHLYETLYQIQHHQAQNSFGRVWTARFEGRQKDACDTAERLWGDNGRQFPGVLKRDISSDASVVPPDSTPSNCR